ncbi:uncharacterized protein M421DRAFT_214197 [Didymella exigua CBS 183.55]|uniref:Uncharacterized protein n=1 Tax=Didymella exigua CBS 183.55 TaxID=1150837 RepID=A0A6A5RF54_9PLEO|nr:uncharacterized protein M421DRAFT_214197 [Didymella exigua CBS 183.55]KAF1926332.1 hypothetical protein M421DRAFT_214197 [Didymella exigua CBS 183.55]
MAGRKRRKAVNERINQYRATASRPNFGSRIERERASKNPRRAVAGLLSGGWVVDGYLVNRSNSRQTWLRGRSGSTNEDRANENRTRTKTVQEIVVVVVASICSNSVLEE